MNYLTAFTKGVGLLSKPGDSILAKITDTGRHVIKANISGQKISSVRYPGGTEVITTVVKR